MKTVTPAHHWAAFFRWLWPARSICELCGAHCLDSEDPRPICPDCEATMLIPSRRPVCTCCLRPLQEVQPLLCATCAADVPFVAVTAVGLYRGPLATAVKRLKFGGRYELARPLGRLLAARLAGSLPAAGVLVPVPLHRARRWERGYNQAGLLARSAAGQLGLPIAGGWLRRMRATPRQARLPAAERGRDLSGVFVARPACRGLCCILVDDVFTTGATIRGAAQALLRAGAAEVRVAVLAVSDLPVTNHRPRD